MRSWRPAPGGGLGGRPRMLYLTRKIGESVVINGEIEVTVIEIRGKSTKLGFTFPSTSTVLRREIHDRIQEENRAAAAGSDALAAAMKRGRADTAASPREREPGEE